MKDYINWQAVDNASKHWHKINGPQFTLESYQEWMLHENGVAHGMNFIRVTDEEKYLMFLLRWS